MKVLLLLLTFTLFCCSKEKAKGKYCFHCTFGRSAAGWQKPALDTCGDNPRGDWQFKDPYGNDLTSICEPR